MTKLSCDNKFCIYQKQETCILEKVELDTGGNCVDCIYINVEENTLNGLKETLLKNLHD